MSVPATEIEAQKIQEKILAYLAEGKKVFATCSFQSQSMPLLHIISQLDVEVPVYYTNTGFLFPETLSFMAQVCEQLGIKAIGLRSEVPKNRQFDRDGRFLYASDPDHCCYLNKVQPLEPILMEHDIWINGIRADQSVTRSQMSEEEEAPFGCLRYHPMLGWTAKMIYEYRKRYDLPSHPLEEKGYLSIGCEPCTSKFFDEGNERNARWFGMNKTECGLHTDLIASDRVPA